MGKGSPIVALSTWKGLQEEIPAGATPWGVQVVRKSWKNLWNR